MSLRVLIADDESLARDRLRQLLQAEPDVELVGECASGMETVKAIHEKSPDLVLLDVGMPEMDGFGVLGAFPAQALPLIVFVTAHDQFAVRAFETQAVDYLLKPFDRQRFQKALQRAKARLLDKKANLTIEQLVALVESLKSPSKSPERISVKSSGRVVFLKLTEIDWIGGSGNYAELHVGKSVHLLRQTLESLATELPSNQFVRINRSFIVNVERIREIRPKSRANDLVVLQDGTQLSSSRRYRKNLARLLRKAV